MICVQGLQRVIIHTSLFSGDAAAHMVDGLVQEDSPLYGIDSEALPYAVYREIHPGQLFIVQSIKQRKLAAEITVLYAGGVNPKMADRSTVPKFLE